MANHKTEQIYARPYADSDDSTLRGHITSGWTEGSVAVSMVGEEVVGRSQLVKNAQGEVLRVPLEEHARLQRTMAELAMKYDGMSMPGDSVPKDIDSTDFDALSASRQLAESGIIDQVPGVRSTRIEVSSVVEQVDIPVTFSKDAAAPAVETAISIQDRIDTLVQGLSESEKLQLEGYADALNAKRLAQLYHNGQGSIENGQLAGQYLLSMSSQTKAVASRYVALYSALRG